MYDCVEYRLIESDEYRGQANYGLAKAGVVGLTKVIAKEWGPQFGVRANTLSLIPSSFLPALFFPFFFLGSHV